MIVIDRMDTIVQVLFAKLTLLAPRINLYSFRMQRLKKDKYATPDEYH